MRTPRTACRAAHHVAGSLIGAAALLNGCSKAPPPPPPNAPNAAQPAPDPASRNESRSNAAAAPSVKVIRTVRAATNSFTVRWSALPEPIPVSDPFEMEVELFEDEACTRPLAGGTLTVDAAMPHHGHGMNVKPTVREVGPGRYHVVGMLCHMPGRWEFAFDRTVDGLLERAQMTVELK